MLKNSARLQSRLVCASTLADEEARLSDHLGRYQPVKYGCTELDGAVLVGGLRRGSVVGISADDAEGFGLLMGLQGMVRAILEGSVTRTLVITPKPLASISKLIVDITKSELSESGFDQVLIQEKCRACLDRVMLSVVFDIDGIWQTLSELLQPMNEITSPAVTSKNPKTEIQRSEDGDVSRYLGQESMNLEGKSRATSHDALDEHGVAICPPEIIVITHFSTLLTSLFARREKTEAHKTLSFLKTRLRGLSRYSSTSPLLLLINSTTEGSSNRHQESALDFGNPTTGYKSPDPTLNLVFGSGGGLRTSRPSFGIVFSQFLDLHLFCTDFPAHRAASSCCLTKLAVSFKGGCQQHSSTLVEVLQDNLGLNSTHVHEDREQRWAVLDVSGPRIVNPCGH